MVSDKCSECGHPLCNASVYDRAHGCTFVCSLPADHTGSHLDRPQVARWTDATHHDAAQAPSPATATPSEGDPRG